MSPEVAELRREIETRDAFLSRASAMLTDVVERVATGASTFDELRAFARELSIIAGREEALVPQRATLDLAEHVARVVERWKEKTQGRVAIALDTTRAGDAKGSWDPDQLDTMLGELVSNACKYGGGRAVVVSVESDDAMVRILVDDDGAGVEMETPGRFRRGVGDAVSKVPGFGVGVWLTQRLANAHGGTFRLSRRPEGGTRASVELPRS